MAPPFPSLEQPLAQLLENLDAAEVVEVVAIEAAEAVLEPLRAEWTSLGLGIFKPANH